MRLRGSVLVTVSQSGRSPDLVALQAAARQAGALTVAFVNQDGSPLGDAADILVPLHAGPEASVAATKSFIASVAAAAALVAALGGDAQLAASVAGLPGSLEAALASDWSPAIETFTAATSLFVVGRGTALPIAQEMALKGKETAALHAEAFSTAEVMHGPLRLVERGFPVLALVPDDAAAATGVEAIRRLEAAGGRLFAASPLKAGGTRLPSVATGHGFTDAIAMTPAFYHFLEAVTRARGFDPDRPTNLAKVTETV